ncbi:uncharacterized protein LOC110735274 [Chenopodium quinoa]|uniref:Uncharacterized protein n=1 Tax=Chenopodium quinoa TaxID=63459 RepID=A0A803N613_CHEQI|nr:uncharacterized protein LOC110735274 [Chenopodium quinoa]
MPISLLITSTLSQFLSSWRRPMIIYAGVWTLLLTVTVAVAALTPETTFIWAITPTSPFSTACKSEGSLRVPVDLPSDVVCLPAKYFQRSKIDLFVSPIFAALVVASSACVVRSFGM